MQWNPASTTTHWTALNWSCEQRRGGRCGGLEMAPHVNKWSPLDGAHKQRVTVIVTTSELS